MTKDTQEFLKKIAEGDFDENLDSLSNVVRGRKQDVRDQRNRAAFLTIQVGDRVRFNESTRPKRAIGQTGTVTQKLQKKIEVKIDDGAYVTTPMGLIDVISS